jgi:HK97 gp10 family phage protein
MLKASVTFKNHTDEALTGVGKAISTAVQKSLAVMERNIKVNTPIRSGTLARSITQRLNTPFDGDIFTAPLVDGKEIDYAIHVEYGTKYMAPRAMFRKGVAQSEKKIEQIFNDELGKKVV